MKLQNQQGFTLIELLVVVLIIGILAAVALPQYQKAVEKSRVAEARLLISNMQKNIDTYLLEHGYPADEWDVVEFLGATISNEYGNFTQAQTVLDFNSGLNCSSVSAEGDGFCDDASFVYMATCIATGCSINAFRKMSSWKADNFAAGTGAEGIEYTLSSTKNSLADAWNMLHCTDNINVQQGKCATLL